MSGRFFPAQIAARYDGVNANPKPSSYPMKHAIPLAVALLIGSLAGGGIVWYFSYQRYAKKQAELLAEYRSVKEEARMSDVEIADLGSRIPQFFEDTKRQDEMAAVVAASAFQSLERGDVDTTKRNLAKHIGSYYRLHANGGDPRLVKEIEAMARDYPLIAEQTSEGAK